MTQLSEDQIALPSQLPRPESAIVFWIIYDHPKDYPDCYVLRAQAAMDDETLISSVAWFAESPKELEAILPAGVTRITPDVWMDDPVILSIWME